MTEAPVVTAVEAGPKRGRVTVMVDGQPALDLPRAFAETLFLTVGQSLLPDQQTQIRRDGALYEARLAAVRALGRRALSTVELRRRLLARDLPEEAVEATLQWLAERHLLDDQQYAEQRWVALRQRRLGTRGIMYKLRQEGITEDLADEVRGASEDSALDETLARDLAEKRNQELLKVPWPQRRQRIYAYLLRRGFDGDVIQDALARLDLDESSSEEA